jgi:hypothetical protein
MPSQVASELLDFDMDRYVNPWLPHNRVGRLPAPISRFLLCRCLYRHSHSRRDLQVRSWSHQPQPTRHRCVFGRQCDS